MKINYRFAVHDTNTTSKQRQISVNFIIKDKPEWMV